MSVNKEYEEAKRKAVLSMDNCYLEIGTHQKNVVQKQAIPPALRGQIFDQILNLKWEDGSKMMGIMLSEDRMKEWIQDSFGHLNPQYKGFFLIC